MAEPAPGPYIGGVTEPIRYARLDSRALVRVTGPEARPFLHNLLSQDVETLSDGDLRFGALLTPQGRLIHDLFILGDGEDVVLDVAARDREALVTRLTMYRLRAKIGIETDDRAVAALFPCEGSRPGWRPDPRLAALGLRGYGVDAPDDASPADEADYDSHRLAHGVPGPADWAGDSTYPIEADFDLLNGIDFRKGCFVGQETTSRMKRRGQIKTRMAPIAFDGPPPAAGSEILAGELRAGEVLSGVEGRAMASLRLDRIEGASLTVNGRPVEVRRPAWFTA